MIHPTAVVHPGARLGANVRVGPYCVIEDGVTIGEGSFLGAHVVVGAEAEHSTEKLELRPRERSAPVVVGRGVVLREYVSLHRPLGEVTRIDDGAYLMARAHVDHDCHVGPGAVLAIGVILAGDTRVHRGANLGVGAVTHQHSTVGAYAMIAANATVVKDVPPLATFIPGKSLGLNAYALRRWGLPFDVATFAELLSHPEYRRLLDEWQAGRHPSRPAHPMPPLAPTAHRLAPTERPVSPPVVGGPP